MKIMRIMHASRCVVKTNEIRSVLPNDTFKSKIAECCTRMLTKVR